MYNLGDAQKLIYLIVYHNTHCVFFGSILYVLEHLVDGSLSFVLIFLFFRFTLHFTHVLNLSSNLLYPKSCLMCSSSFIYIYTNTYYTLYIYSLHFVLSFSVCISINIYLNSNSEIPTKPSNPFATEIVIY